jgi:multimeric flavodoxin WrbA
MQKIQQIVDHCKGKRVLLLCTSTRWEGSDEVAKSTQLAKKIQDEIGEGCELMDITKLHIYQCEGNVSREDGNRCGLKESSLKDATKNPTGYHRCWASFNHKDDELWKISRSLFESDVVLLFGSIRWGQVNSVWQKLIERLTWIENRHSTLEENNVVANIEAGCILLGHNWKGEDVLSTQKAVLQFFGFRVPEALSFNWQWTTDMFDESEEGYDEDLLDFRRTFEINSRIAESFEEWLAEAEYKSGKRKPTPEEIEMCKSPEGFNQINHCKALGLIPREDGTVAVSKKYGGRA